MKKQLCTFSIDEIKFGVDVSQVQEILRHQEITAVPLAPPTIAGLLNLRGQIVMVTDLKKKFSLLGKIASNPIFIILRGDDGPACFMVDKVGEVLEINDVQREPLPPQLDVTIRECAIGVYSIANGLIVELNAETMNETTGSRIEA
jgi:purine-binding chemotaxis protein CheW